MERREREKEKRVNAPDKPSENTRADTGRRVRAGVVEVDRGPCESTG
jgi:hypothetical protein